MKSALGFWLVIGCILWGIVLAGVADAITEFSTLAALGLLAGTIGMAVVGALAVVLLYTQESDKL